jgi:hypothetical protein
MILSTNTQCLLSNGKVGTFKGYKETNSGLLLRFIYPERGRMIEQTFSKYEIIKKV